MQAAAVTTFSNTSPRTTVGPAWHQRVGGLNVLKVQGTPYEMARQHGTLLRDAIRLGPLPYYREYTEKLVGRAAVGQLSPWVWPLLQKTLGKRVAKTLPDFGRDMVQGLADGAQLPYQDVLDGCTMPDALMWMAARAMQLKGPGPAMKHRLNLALGCTSAVAWGDATTDGQLLHARNFDYHGVGCWPKTAAVVFHQPHQGHRYLSVTAAGIVGGGVTAMNSAGLTLTVHQHMFTDQTRFGGTPIGLVGDRIMREAASVAEAQAILRQYRPIGCWTYLITDGKTGDVLCWEEDPQRHAAIRPAPGEDTFGYANIYRDPTLGATEVAYYGAYWRHNEARYRRAHDLLAQGRGSLDPEAMATILADPGAQGCRVAHSIAMVMTVASVVFKPAEGKAWIASGEAPTSHGTFIPFDLNAESWDEEAGFSVAHSVEPAARQAFEAFRQGYLHYVDEYDVPAARRALDRAIELRPKESLYLSLNGLLALSQGDFAVAQTLMDRAVSAGHPDPERRAAFHLWRGRARDLLGRREEAKADYRWSLGYSADEPVHRAARRGLRRAYPAWKARRVKVDWAFADVLWP